MKKIGLILALIINLQIAFSQEKEVEFNDAYKQLNEGKTTIEINEMQELIYIILSLTETANNPNIINQNTNYYKEVKEKFSSLSNHEIVTTFDYLLKENLVNFILLPGNAYGFSFNNNNILPTNVYNFAAKGIGKYELKENPILQYITKLEDFAKQSNFRIFYREHQNLYASLIKEYQDFASIDEQKKWLEQKFDYKIDSYRILTSPLINSINATHTFEDNDFRETLLFLPTIRNDKEWSKVYKKMQNTRVIFTEIDHNYVGLVSEKYKNTINTIFDQREIWLDTANKGTQHYPNPIKIFDEYLTWALYITYAYDNFSDSPEEFKTIIESVNNIMVNKRGFIKFKDYSAFLIHLYKKDTTVKIESLYPTILEWASKQR